MIMPGIVCIIKRGVLGMSGTSHIRFSERILHHLFYMRVVHII
jgi:hypothetical protein